MEDILHEHIANIIDCSQALLREEEGELNVKQRRGIRSIIANAEILVHLVTEFLAVPLNEVTADLRHELANPLTPIRGYSELLSMGMMQLPPAMVSLPFKVLLFIMVDGWNLVITSLVKSYA